MIATGPATEPELSSSFTMPAIVSLVWPGASCSTFSSSGLVADSPTNPTTAVSTTIAGKIDSTL